MQCKGTTRTVACAGALALAAACLVPTGAFAAPKAEKAALRSTAVAHDLTAEQAYADVLSWASGSRKQDYLTALYERIEREAYRYNIIPEFAIAVISAEAKYGNRVSFARYDSWKMFQQVTGSKPQIPSALDDLDTAFSELRQIMDSSKTLNDVYKLYWSGPDGSYNADSLPAFGEAVSKLYNGLEPFARARMQNESKKKYTPDYYNQKTNTCDEEPSWAGLASGDMEGYSSKLGSMPTLASRLQEWPRDEENYARMARKYNKNLTVNESIVIARAILTYCYEVDNDWKKVDPRLVMALVRAESCFKPNARSGVGALGLGQLMPATARGMGIRDPLDPVQNLYGCVKYLERESYRWRNSPNKIALMLASYNAGPGAVQKYGGVPPYQETRNYVKIVTRYYNDFIKQ